MDRPAEKTKAWYEYREIFINDKRIDGGVAFYREHADTLQRAQQETGVPAEIIVAIAKGGVPVVLVEQNAELALRLSDYAYVLETGAIALEGPSSELHENDHVRRAYLGG